jgi:hypothetical protein
MLHAPEQSGSREEPRTPHHAPRVDCAGLRAPCHSSRPFRSRRSPTREADTLIECIFTRTGDGWGIVGQLLGLEVRAWGRAAAAPNGSRASAELRAGRPHAGAARWPPSWDGPSSAVRRTSVVQGGADRAMDGSFVDEFAAARGGVREAAQMAATRSADPFFSAPAAEDFSSVPGRPVFTYSYRVPCKIVKALRRTTWASP